jgi:hypothetical protein
MVATPTRAQVCSRSIAMAATRHGCLRVTSCICFPMIRSTCSSRRGTGTASSRPCGHSRSTTASTMCSLARMRPSLAGWPIATAWCASATNALAHRSGDRGRAPDVHRRLELRRLRRAHRRGEGTAAVPVCGRDRWRFRSLAVSRPPGNPPGTTRRCCRPNPRCCTPTASRYRCDWCTARRISRCGSSRVRPWQRRSHARA